MHSFDRAPNASPRILEVLELVEARAGRGEQHDVAGLGDLGRRARRRVRGRPMSRRARPSATRLDRRAAASPISSARRTRPRGRVGQAARSRRPCRGRRRSTRRAGAGLRARRAAAPTLVAFESFTQATPSMAGDELAAMRQARSRPARRPPPSRSTSRHQGAAGPPACSRACGSPAAAAPSSGCDARARPVARRRCRRRARRRQRILRRRAQPGSNSSRSTPSGLRGSSRWGRRRSATAMSLRPGARRSGPWPRGSARDPRAGRGGRA